MTRYHTTIGFFRIPPDYRLLSSPTITNEQPPHRVRFFSIRQRQRSNHHQRSRERIGDDSRRLRIDQQYVIGGRGENVGQAESETASIVCGMDPVCVQSDRLSRRVSGIIPIEFSVEQFSEALSRDTDDTSRSLHYFFPFFGFSTSFQNSASGLSLTCSKVLMERSSSVSRLGLKSRSSSVRGMSFSSE